MEDSKFPIFLVVASVVSFSAIASSVRAYSTNDFLGQIWSVIVSVFTGEPPSSGQSLMGSAHGEGGGPCISCSCLGTCTTTTTIKTTTTSSSTSSTTTSTLLSTTTTTPSNQFLTEGDFNSQNFDSQTISGGYNITVDYTKNAAENMNVVFAIMNASGYVTYHPTAVASLDSGIVFAPVLCSGLASGSYSVAWIAYLSSDTNLTNPVSWSKSSELVSMNC